MAQLTFVVVSDRSEFREALEATSHVEIAACLGSVETLRETVRRCRPDGLFVDLGVDPEAVLDEVEALPAPRPFLLVAGPAESGLILRAMRLGAREYVSPPSDPGVALRGAIERLLMDDRVTHAPAKQAPVLAVMGCKGGVGSTFTACQLATGLARGGARVALVDLNLRLGDVALYLDLGGNYTATDLPTDAEMIDSALLKTVLSSHPSGVQVLAAPQRLEDAESISAAQVERSISLLRGEFDWVVLDISNSFEETALRALELADRVLLVMTPDVPSLNHARRHLDVLRRLGRSDESVCLVVNRTTSGAPVNSRDIEKFMDRGPDFEIPNDFPVAHACVNEGISVWDAPHRGRLRGAFDELVQCVRDWFEAGSGDEHEKRGLSKWLRRKRHGAA